MIKEGDCNTKYIHTLASIRRRKNQFESLAVGGEIVDKPDEIKKKAVTYFQSIFHEEHPIRPTFNGLIFNKPTATNCSFFVAPFSHEEIDVTIDSCDTSGPDGLNFKFIKIS